MANRWQTDLTEAAVTPEHIYMNRRHWIAGGAAGPGLAWMGMARAGRWP
jgi:dihydroorotase